MDFRQPLNHLWSNVVWGSTEGSCDNTFKHSLLTHAEISQFTMTILIQQNIIQLQIPEITHTYNTHIIICPDSVHYGHYSREREIYVNIFFYLLGKTLLQENLHYNLSKEKLQMALHVKMIAFLWHTHTFKIMFILCHTFIFCPR